MTMEPLQLGGLFDASLFGVPVILVLIVGGLIAMVAGAVIRVQVEGVRETDDGPLSVTGSDGGRAPGDQARIGETNASHDQSAASRAVDRDDLTPTGDGSAGRSGEVEAAEDDVHDLVRKAASRYDGGDFDGAIQAAYMFVRVRLGDELEISTDGTHWDFFGRCTDAGLAYGEDPLRELTEVYEQAAFGSRPSSEDDADRALQLMAELTGAAVPDVA